MIIQLLVIIFALSLFFVVVSGRHTHTGKAWQKIGLTILAICMVTAVLFPEATNKLAHIFGIGRGADLLLYLLALAFIASTLTNYLHQQEQRDAIFRLARKIAIIEALDDSNKKNRK